MYPSSTPPHRVKIGDAAAFAGTTPRAIRHYHEIGLLPEPERGADGRRYGYDDMIRILWIRKMAGAGISLDDIRAAFDQARIFGPLGAAVQASVFIVLATHPELRAEQDRLDAAEAALDDGVEPFDPRVEELAVLRCAQQMALDQAIEAAGLDRAEERLFEIYDADLKGEEDTRMSAFEAVTKMPYGFSPARMRCMELTAQLLAQAHSTND